ncbi:hypothetical protein LEP1GSC107_0271 [Leptospira interrogans serovar Grippotyphosa str. UI 12769]|nr:hypothetical protein LEP1GSC080_3116 [Leptospira interrogans str. FPW2026]EKR46944.1 hypothetical protein LEP1GSC097_2523 [Leptospira interrogans serovar Grippotyphosa str. UI 08368]EMJ50344.1 hypothetical protein LEP1GSC111_1473 [Leptospira interrogans str. UT126]EMN87417.1 hypothetical protein LEP1GSC107_0271 [Leptospira interrogans serovar Grippotyphosa str. UI 12769]
MNLNQMPFIYLKFIFKPVFLSCRREILGIVKVLEYHYYRK